MLLATAAAASATDVGVSVSVNQPGVYGRIDIGNVPQPPQVVYREPVIITPAPRPVVVAPQPVAVVAPQPIYMYVPPGHQRNWRHYCGRYHACGQPVYFVQEGWYRTNWVPAHQHHGHGHDHDRDHDHGPGRGHDDDQGHGNGHGRGHDKHHR